MEPLTSDDRLPVAPQGEDVHAGVGERFVDAQAAVVLINADVYAIGATVEGSLDRLDLASLTHDN